MHTVAAALYYYYLPLLLHFPRKGPLSGHEAATGAPGWSVCVRSTQAGTALERLLPLCVTTASTVGGPAAPVILLWVLRSEALPSPLPSRNLNISAGPPTRRVTTRK